MTARSIARWFPWAAAFVAGVAVALVATPGLIPRAEAKHRPSNPLDGFDAVVRQ